MKMMRQGRCQTFIFLFFIITSFTYVSGAVEVVPSAATGINIPKANLAELAPTGATTSIAGTATGALLTYATGSGGWAGGGFSYDLFSTEEVESVDLSGISEYVIGLQGSPERVKFELHDNQGLVASAILIDISPAEERFWAMPASLFEGIDRANITAAYCIIEGPGLSGTLAISADTATAYQTKIPSSPTFTVNDINLPTADKAVIVPAGAFAAASVIDYGIWIRHGSEGWTELYPVSPKTVVTADLDGDGKDEVIADFGPGYGIWINSYIMGWTQLHWASARSINVADMNGNGKGDVIVDFGPGYGIWIRYDDGQWLQLNNVSACSITSGNLDNDAEGKDDVIVDFGSGYGIWIYSNNAAWAPLQGASARSVTVADMNGNGKGDVIVDFGPGYGIWIRYDDGQWLQLNNVSARSITSGNLDNDAEGKDDVIVDFGSVYGIWIYSNNAAWAPLQAASAERIVCGNLDNDAEGKDDVIVDFGYQYGIWIYYNGSFWQRLNETSARATVIGDIDTDADREVIVNFGSDNGVRVSYDTGTASDVAGGVWYDFTGTGAAESADFSAYTDLIIGLKGSPGEIVCEITDRSGASASVTLTGIDANMYHAWRIPSALLADIDMSAIVSVAARILGSGSTGSLDILLNRSMPLKEAIPVAPLLTGDHINLPGIGENYPAVAAIAPSGAVANIYRTTRGAYLEYQTGIAGWALGGFEYGAYDLSNLDRLVIGLKGSPGAVVLEVNDARGNRASVRLTGIVPDVERVWEIPVSLLKGIDRTVIATIYAIVEGSDLSGTLAITRVPGSAEPLFLDVPPSPTASARMITMPPSNIAEIAPAGATAHMEVTASGATLTCITGAAGWAGGGYAYDSLTTDAVETADLSGFSTITVGLKGTPANVKFEIVDAAGNHASVRLMGISPTTEKFWQIAMAVLAGQGVDLTRVRFIYFIVEGNGLETALQINLRISKEITPEDEIQRRAMQDEHFRAFSQSGVGYHPQTGWAYDHINLSVDGNSIASSGTYTSPTNIGLSMVEYALVAKGDITVTGLTASDALQHLAQEVHALYTLPADQKWHGFYYWYGLSGAAPVKSGDNAISPIDNGNLAFAFAAVAGAFLPDVANTADPDYAVKRQIVDETLALINAMEWSMLVDPARQLMYISFDTGLNEPSHGLDGTPFHIDSRFDEWRLGVLFAITVGNISADNWWNMMDASTEYTTAAGDVLKSYKSGNGGMFQAFLPRIFIREDLLSPYGFGESETNFVAIHAERAAANGLPALFSASENPLKDPDTPNGYDEFGAAPLVLKPWEEFNPAADDDTGYEEVAAPHATALSYLVDPKFAIAQLGALDGYAGMRTPFGYRDAITKDLPGGRLMSSRMLSLDHGMFVLALAGDTVSDYTRRYFDYIGRADYLARLLVAADLGVRRNAFRTEIPATPALAGADVNLPVTHTNLIVPGGATGAFTKTATGAALTYATGEAGWIAAGLTYDATATAEGESVDLSGLGGRFVIGLTGTLDHIIFETVDTYGRKKRVTLTGIDPVAEQFWAIPFDLLTGIDLTNIAAFYFVVEGADLSGSLTARLVTTAAPRLKVPSSYTAVEADINLPNADAMGIAPDGATGTGTYTSCGAHIEYATNAAGWAGGGFTYDSFATSSIESIDLSGLSRIVIGIKGTAGTVKMELVDASGASVATQLTGIRPDRETIWTIPVTELAGIDLGSIRYAFFIIEGNNKTGTLDIRGLWTSDTVMKSLPASTPYPAINIPRLYTAQVGHEPPARSCVVTNIASPYGIRLEYDTGSVGWVGGGIAYDNLGTGPVETRDLSALSKFVIGLTGATAKVKFEMEDNVGHKAFIYLTGISASQEQVWDIPITRFSGIDLHNVRFIFFVIEGNDQVGTLDVHTI